MTESIQDAYALLRARLPRVRGADAPVLAALGEDLRHWDGRWWRAFEYANAPDQMPLAILLAPSVFPRSDAPRWQAILAHRDGYGRVRPYGPETWVADGSPALLPGEYDAPDVAAAKLEAATQAALDSAILVDGVLHGACAGPVLVVRRPRDDHRIRGQVGVTSATNVRLGEQVALFAHDRAAEAIEFASRWHGKPARLAEHARIDPAAPARNDAEEVFAELVHDVLGGCRQVSAGLVHPSVLDCIADLRTLSEARIYPPIVVREVLESLAGLAAEPPPEVPSRALAAMAEEAACRLREVTEFAYGRVAYEDATPPEDEAILSGLVPGGDG